MFLFPALRPLPRVSRFPLPAGSAGKRSIYFTSVSCRAAPSPVPEVLGQYRVWRFLNCCCYYVMSLFSAFELPF